MADQIMNNDGMAVAREQAWHGKAIVLPDLFTAENAINYANLGWEVAKERLRTIEGHEVMGQYATVRSDDNSVLGVVGEQYTPLQNVESFDFFDAIVGEGHAIYESAGSLFGGRKVFLLAKLPFDIQVGDKDTVKQYLLLSNSHDGSSAVTALFTPVRVVCNNTLTAALRGNKSGQIKIKHTINMHQKISEAHKLLGIVARTSQETGDFYRAMASRKVSPVEIDQVLETLVPDGKGERNTRTENIRAKMLDLIENGEGNRLGTARGTLWGVYNGITEYISHERTVKGLGENGEDPEGRRMEQICFGTGATLREKATRLMQELVNSPMAHV